MKIKGAFPVRWAAQDGADGKGVTVESQKVMYASSTDGVTQPTSGWQSTIPKVENGNFLWTWLHISFSDGTHTDLYSSTRQGIDGKGIQSSVVTYSQQANPVDPTTIQNWGSFPSTLTDGYWLYTKTHIVYSDKATTDSYSVAQVGVGSYYAGCQEYYAVSNSKTTPPNGYPKDDNHPYVDGVATYVNGEDVNIGSAWSTDRPIANTENPYIWNFEISRDSRGNKYVTAPVCIGNFAKGITSIVETYAISAENSIPEGEDYPSDIKETDWKDEHFAAAPTDDKPYQWNKTTTTYNDGTVQYNYHISAIKGIDGKGAVYLDLDNENDSMLYDGAGNLISGVVASNVRLYVNGVNQTSGNSFSIDSSSGVYARISGSVLTVSAMTANSGYVVVKCIYNGVSYYARFTCKKIIGTDKYEIICTPSAITYNSDTESSIKEISIEVYRTSQNGSRTLLPTLPTGYSLVCKWLDGQMKLVYNSGSAAFQTDVSGRDRFRVELLDNNNKVIDYETIPIGHVSNGNAFLLDADNTNISFAVDNSGNCSEEQRRTVNLSSYYGSEKVTSGISYEVVADGNTDANGNNLLELSDVRNGAITITARTGYTWNRDKVVNIKITAKHSVYGTRTVVLSCVPVFAGATGQPATIYELQPSLDVLSFARNETGGYAPSFLEVYCGYMKIIGTTRTSYAGNIVSNLSNIDGKYAIMGRYHKSDGSFEEWKLAKDQLNGTFSVNGSSDYTAIEFIFTSAKSVNGVSDSNIFDREIIPIMRDGANGETAFYYIIPSTEKVTRKHDGTLIPDTINCEVYKKIGTNEPEVVTSEIIIGHYYYTGTKKSDDFFDNKLSPSIWCTRITFFAKSSDGAILAQRDVYVVDEEISPEQNVLNDTNFVDISLDSSTNRYNSEVLEGEGVDGNNALLGNPISLENSLTYTDVWQQAVSQTNDARLLPSTWYTLSYWAKTLGCAQISIKQSSNLYGFATKRIYLPAGTHRLTVRGYVSSLAASANRELRVFVYNNDWSWSTSVSITQSSITEAEVTFTTTTDGTYFVSSYCYLSGGGNAAAEQTVYVEWYRLLIAGRNNKLQSYCYPDIINTRYTQIHDGEVADTRPSDGNYTVDLTGAWKRYYMVFKTKSTIPTTINNVLFRIPENGNSVCISQMKLERGVFPTAWTGSNRDSKGYNGAKPNFKKYSQLQGTTTKVYQGVGDEEWYTIVYDDVENSGWYVPKYTHDMSTDESLKDDSKWLLSNMTFVATALFFAQMAYIENLGVRNVLLSDGSNIEGGMCYNDADGSLGLGKVRFWLGAANPAEGKIRGYEDGKFVAANGNAVFETSGDVKLCGGNATFDKDGNTTIKKLKATDGEFDGVIRAKSFLYGTNGNKIIDGDYTIDKSKGINNFLANYDSTIHLPAISTDDDEGLQIVISVNSYNESKYVYILTDRKLVKVNYHGDKFNEIRLGNGSIVLCVIAGSWRVIAESTSRIVGIDNPL